MNTLKELLVRNDFLFYFCTFSFAVILAYLSAPIFRWIAIKWDVMDHPSSSVKTHRTATPYLGGCAIATSFFIILVAMRFLSNYPMGTLRPLLGVLIGSAMVFSLGLIDDVISGGLGFKLKFVIQFLAAALLIFFDIQIHFIEPRWLSWLLTLFWIVGIMNAFNIIDIMDGLSGSTAAVAAFAFLFISLPTEHIYVNFAAIVLAGAIIGFLPHNFSKQKKMFMGDTGSLFIGYILGALSLGTPYSTLHNAGVLAPILILGVPIYDTLFVMLLRYRKGMSPFLGSKDHYALRLEKMGYSRLGIVGISIIAATILSLCAYLTTMLWFWFAVGIYGLVFTTAYFIGVHLAKVNIE